MRLTQHFQLEEFTRSATARRLGIDNTLTPTKAYDRILIGNLQRLCEQVLEPLRQHANSPRHAPSPLEGEPEQLPIHINSGYRCLILNRAVGGSPTSNHISGCAADIRIPDIPTGREWFEWLQAHVPFDELIWERATPTGHPWIHVALRPETNRRRVIPDLVKQ